MEKKNEFSRADSTLMGNIDVTYEFASASTASYSTNIFYGTREITNFNFNVKEQNIEVTFRKTNHLSYPNGQQHPDKVWKEIYGIKDNKLLLLKTIEGKHTPGYYVEETIEFQEEPEEEKKAED